MIPIQCKMGRSATGLGIRDLAKKANVAAATVTRFERGGGVRLETLKRLQGTLENQGIIFLDADETTGPGVRLKKPRRAKR